MSENRIREIEVRLAAMEAERAVLSEELGKLTAVATPASPQELPKSAVEKADLFLKLFRARESVYPRLWENPRTGRKGYAPACRNEWVRGFCEKPKVKCSDCRYQSFLPLDREAVLDHLRGQQTIGIYDYIEPANALTMSMHRKRLSAYRQMGYRVESLSSASGQWLFHPGIAGS